MPRWTNAVEQARHAALALLHGNDAREYRPSGYFWSEQFGLDLKMVGPLEPQGDSTVLDGGLEQGSALLAWPDVDTPRHVVALNHHTSPVKLKRMLR